MMVECDPILIEQVVCMLAHRDPSVERRLHRRVDRLYRVPNPTVRDEQFREAYAKLFLELKLDQPIMSVLNEFPTIANHVERCLIRMVPRQRDEVAELFHPGEAHAAVERFHRTGGLLTIGVRASSFLDPTAFLENLRRELLHIADILDPAFAFERDALLGTHPRQNLVRDRYRVFWDLHIEQRLSKRENDPSRLSMLAPRLARVLPDWLPDQIDSASNRIASEPRMTHATLLAWAEDPASLLSGDTSRTDSPAQGHGRGGDCPLCRFTTFDWWPIEQVSDELATEIRQRHPAWHTERGLCRRCAETYLAIARARRSRAHRT